MLRLDEPFSTLHDNPDQMCVETKQLQREFETDMIFVATIRKNP